MATVIAPEIDAGINEGRQSVRDSALRDAAGHASVSKALSSAFRSPELVKGVGYVRGQKPIDDYTEIIERLGTAKDTLAEETWRGYHQQADVRKTISPEFEQLMAAALRSGPSGLGPWMGEITSAIQALGAEVGKNFTLSSPLSSGFVPFNLVAPSRLIFPFYSPMRNKLPRTAGQGSSLRAKLIVGIQGSQTGGTAGNAKSMFMAELNGGSLSTWPNQLPAAGTQTAADLNLPYSFQGISESLSWPAQFALN